MDIQLTIPSEIVDANCARFGWDQKTELEKIAQPKEDFIIQLIAGYLKKEAADHIGAQAAALAEKQAKQTLDAINVEKKK